LDARTGGLTAQELQAMLTPQADCRLQEAEKQRRHKLSFYCPGPRMQANQDDLQSRLDRLQLPYQVLGSLDPFNGQGLLDVLPAGVNKASGLRWWAAQQQRPLRTIAYAGDSGNDFAALTDDFLAIVVANADRDLIQRIEQHHLQRGTRPQLYLAQRNATGGVVDGCRWFGLLESTSPQGTSP
jgi:alpha-amylase